MANDRQYQSDINIILSHRHDLGADLWTTPDKRLGKGGAFSIYNSALMLLELGMKPDSPILKEVAELFFSIWREDGRFKMYPSGGILPCHTAYAASLLCQMGYAADERIQAAFQHFLDTPWTDGGWRCKKFSFGRGPETEYSNPLPTLNVLNAFRFSKYLNSESSLDTAVEFLLMHWTVKTPIGPCHYGIGTRFMQIELPISGYNLLNYIYVLSFYNYAKKDERFLEALEMLKSKLVNEQLMVERSAPKLAKLVYCKKGCPSEIATRYYHEIIANLEMVQAPFDGL